MSTVFYKVFPYFILSLNQQKIMTLVLLMGKILVDFKPWHHCVWIKTWNYDCEKTRKRFRFWFEIGKCTNKSRIFWWFCSYSKVPKRVKNDDSNDVLGIAMLDDVLLAMLCCFTCYSVNALLSLCFASLETQASMFTENLLLNQEKVLLRNI